MTDVKEAHHMVTSLSSAWDHTCLNVPEFPGHGKPSALSANTSLGQGAHTPPEPSFLSAVSHRNLYHLISQDGQWEEIWGKKMTVGKKMLKILSVSNKGDTKEKEQLGD